MEIKDKTVLVLGGYGEVGSAVCRDLLLHRPKKLIVSSLRETEALSAVEELKRLSGSCELIPFHGNLFVRRTLKEMTHAEIAQHPELVRQVVDDNLAELSDEILKSSTLYACIMQYLPQIIIDCVNTSTGLAYRDVFYAYEKTCKNQEGDVPQAEIPYSILSAISIPPLIRHVQILHEAMKKACTQVYLKVGTTGTGGMGFNIPFTHGEESPSRLLMSKTALAGAQTMLLFILSRTPGWPVIKEIKPAAMIGWKGVNRGPIMRAGQAVPAYDCSVDESFVLKEGMDFCLNGASYGKAMDQGIRGAYVDTGENGVFSLSEFKVITSLGLMEFMTPEEIAHAVILDLLGINCSKDVIGALDGAVMDPTYRAGCLREAAVKRIEELGIEGTSYGLLGPMATKLIFEADLLKSCYGSFEEAIKASPETASKALEQYVTKNENTRMNAISMGIPVLLSDGKRLLFASRNVRDKNWEQKPWTINESNIDRFARHEWVDLRVWNMIRWQARLTWILDEAQVCSACTSSRLDGTHNFQKRGDGTTPIDAGEVVARVLIKEFETGRDIAYAGGMYL